MVVTRLAGSSMFCEDLFGNDVLRYILKKSETTTTTTTISNLLQISAAPSSFLLVGASPIRSDG